MNDLNLIRQLLDLIDQITKVDDSTSPEINIINIDHQPQDQHINHEEDTDDVETALDSNVFVPPLQQRLELLKKTAGIPPKNQVDDGDDLLDN